MVTDSSSAQDGGGGRGRPLPLFRYGKKLEEQCPIYMALGMSYHDYWDGDIEMSEAYIKAEELRREQRNFDAWLQAAYIYEALLGVAPVFNPLSKKNKPFPFRSEPIPITRRANEESEERKKQKMLEDGKTAMEAMMAAVNKRFQKKGGEVNA